MFEDAPYYARFEVDGRVIHRTTERDPLVIKTIATMIATLYSGRDVTITYYEHSESDGVDDCGDEGGATGAATSEAPLRHAVTATR